MDKVYVLCEDYDEERIIAIHATEQGAKDHREQFHIIDRSSMKVVEWDVEE